MAENDGNFSMDATLGDEIGADRIGWIIDCTSDGSDSTVLYETPVSEGYSEGDRVSIKERISFEHLLCNRFCALCFRKDDVAVWCDRCHAAWCDDQCYFNFQKYSPHSLMCLVRQHNVRVWQTSIYTASASSALDMYCANPFCMHCLGDVDAKGTACGFCDAILYCSKSCHLADAGNHFSLCTNLVVEHAKVTRVFDSIFHRDATETTKGALQNEALAERIKTCSVLEIATGDADVYSACPEESFQLASRRFDFFAVDLDLYLDFCVSDLSRASSSSSFATKMMQRDAMKQVYLFHAKFPTAMLCLPRGQWLNRLDIEKHCSECFSYVSAALLLTAGIPWFSRNVDDIWIMLRARSSMLPSEPCLLLLPLRDHCC